MKAHPHRPRRHLIAAGAAAQGAWPGKPIKLVVPFTAGSGTDIIARTIGDAMGRSLGQPVLVENKPGAAGTIGAAQVAKSATHMKLIAKTANLKAQ